MIFISTICLMPLLVEFLSTGIIIKLKNFFRFADNSPNPILCLLINLEKVFDPFFIAMVFLVPGLYNVMLQMEMERQRCRFKDEINLMAVENEDLQIQVEELRDEFVSSATT